MSGKWQRENVGEHSTREKPRQPWYARNRAMSDGALEPYTKPRRPSQAILHALELARGLGLASNGVRLHAPGANGEARNWARPALGQHP